MRIFMHAIQTAQRKLSCKHEVEVYTNEDTPRAAERTDRNKKIDDVFNCYVRTNWLSFGASRDIVPRRS